ncbi:ABC transporter permease [Gryllotalpicola ginsengisoli]|uniref:ABC transporter permease n=1 Tax=Gryllotalpicola ginsengisoli TaxID=444608 RepID=UPI0003B7AE5E|nr:ABC transporter permease [Gryllotalpicola ginsengisoli]
MNSYSQAFAWLAAPGHWAGPSGIPQRILEHLGYTGLTLLIAIAIALPVGLYIGHTGRGRDVIVPLTGAMRALPTLGIVILLALWIGGIGIQAPLIALVVLALPPVIAGAYAGLESVDRSVIDAARSIGFTGWQVLWQVEVPLALPLIVGGIRSACLQVIATWTVAAYLPVGGLGRFLYDALPNQDYAQMLAGSLIVIVLALLADGLFALVQRLATPRGVAAGRTPDVGTATRSPTRKDQTWLAPEEA